MFFYLSVSDRSFTMGGVGERTGQPICRYFPCARVSGLVRSCRSEKCEEDTPRAGVIRSSIDSYERIVLAHRGTIAANLCCTGLGV